MNTSLLHDFACLSRTGLVITRTWTIFVLLVSVMVPSAVSLSHFGLFLLAVSTDDFCWYMVAPMTTVIDIVFSSCCPYHTFCFVCVNMAHTGCPAVLAHQSCHTWGNGFSLRAMPCPSFHEGFASATICMMHLATFEQYLLNNVQFVCALLSLVVDMHTI